MYHFLRGNALLASTNASGTKKPIHEARKSVFERSQGPHKESVD